MGQVITKNAAATDILADVRTTMTNATAKGGDWQSEAQDRLGSIITLADGVDTRISDATTALAPAEAAVHSTDDTANDLIGRISDDIWNIVGRPGQDPALDILFPGGISYYTEGSVEEQPDRMSLLAELLESGIHPRLPADKATEFATEIRNSADAIQAAVDVYRPIHTRLELAKRMQHAIARVAQVALARLKRQWKADGKTEAEITSVIPDRPRGHSKPKVEG